jgi:hypothetical protein
MGLEPRRSAESRMTICGSHTTLTSSTEFESDYSRFGNPQRFDQNQKDSRRNYTGGADDEVGGCLVFSSKASPSRSMRTAFAAPQSESERLQEGVFQFYFFRHLVDEPQE